MYKVISTFSGIGGSSLGYKMAGLEVLAAVEFLDYQAANYRLNNPDTKVYQSDIRELDPLQILNELNLKVGELDILDGSPPCSSFSTSGSISKGWGKEKAYGNRVQRTDNLFLEYIRFLTVMQPKTFVAENVSGLIKGKSKGHFNIFLKMFQEAGYTVKAKLMNAANYGVPQIRQRIIFIGVRNDLNLEPVFPPTESKIISVMEAFKDIVNTPEDLEEVNGRMKNGELYQVYKDMRAMKVGEENFNLKKIDPFRPAKTFLATAGQGTKSIFHWENRKFTIPELKAIQSFPQDYKFTGAYEVKAEGMGRSVPPKMMCAIAKSVVENILVKIN